MKYELTQELAKELLAYLSQRPFREVNDLIVKMTKLQPVVEKKEEVKKPEPKK